MYNVIVSKFFSNSILLIIISNTVLMALQTTEANKNYGWYFDVIDQAFLGLYIMEAGIKLYAFRIAYFRSGWNSFDFVIVGVSIISVLLPYIIAASSVGFNISILRLLRVFRAFRALRSLRVLRTISILRSLQTIVETVLRSIPALSSIVALMVLILYIFAVIARSSYASVDKQRFGSLATAAFRLFSVMTLDEWSSMYMEGQAKQDGTLFFFLFAFVLFQAFILLNLFVAVIVSNLSNGQKKSLQRMQRAATPGAPLPDPTPLALAAKDTTASQDKLAADTLSQSKRVTTAVRLLVNGDGSSQQAQTSVDMFYPPTMSVQKKHQISHYFALMALLEHNWRAAERQMTVLRDLVDLLQDAPGGLPGF
ncbi:Ion transport protein-domain-containing protein [Catenaria anguillulae PL171]|uniref:Ion transport protein-domain-containing protein n=1 Tax=Catenaria anguillulae PL171 TaxID=765915 RepID=A0A1Y2H4T8_9FUNG|nr:Ion transport protein-domain-containing protein [Catenaria anguillulae PL171]